MIALIILMDFDLFFDAIKHVVKHLDLQLTCACGLGEQVKLCPVVSV